jgi:hypothetical protein
MITAVYRGFSGGPGRVSALIRRLDRVTFNGLKLAPVINHVYRRFEFNDRPSLINESHYNGGVQITPHNHLLDAIKTGKVTHHYEKRINVTPEQADLLWKKHEELHGDGYDLGLILSYWTWLRFGGRDSSRKFTSNLKNRRHTCNEYYAVTSAGIEPDVPEIDLRLTPEAFFIKTFGMPSALYFKAYGRVGLSVDADGGRVLSQSEIDNHQSAIQ